MSKKINKECLIQRLYRISKEADKQVKKKAKKYNGESAYIRHLIESDNLTKE